MTIRHLLVTSQPDSKNKYSNAEKEKRRIGEFWLTQLTKVQKWVEAGEIAGKVLNTTSRWEHWAWIFIRQEKYDEITPFIPAMELVPPLSSSVFEAVPAIIRKPCNIDPDQRWQPLRAPASTHLLECLGLPTWDVVDVKATFVERGVLARVLPDVKKLEFLSVP